MRKSMILGIIAVFLLSSMAASVSALEYFMSPMNFEPGTATNHTHTFTYNGNLTVIKPSQFTYVSSIGSPNVSGNYIKWNGSASVYLVLESPDNCTEGDIYESGIYLNDSLVDKFRYVCMPDNKIVDYKAEYGHGDANYLTDLYVSNESATLFNLIRVWNLGGYLEPNEDALNVSIECRFEDYPVRTWGRVEVVHDTDGINGTFAWDEIGGGYWFRIGVLSHDIPDLPVGATFNVTCENLVYEFEHQLVNASFGTYTIEVRNTQPFNVTCYNISGDPNHWAFTIENIEKYSAFDMYFDRELDDFQSTQELLELDPGESITWKVDNSNYNTTIHYIPSWYRNSRNPTYYEQYLQCNPSGVYNITPTPSTSATNCTVNVSVWDALISGKPTGVNITVVCNGTPKWNATVDVVEVNGYSAFALPQRITSNVTSIATARTYTDNSGFVALTITPTGGAGLIGSEKYVGNYSIYVDVTVDGTMVNRTYLNNTQRVLHDATGIIGQVPSRSDIVSFHNLLAVVYDKINDWLV